METPNYIKKCELTDGILSTNKIIMPLGFDDFVKDKKMELVYGESNTDFETGKTSFNSKIYKTKQGFYLHVLFKEVETDVTIYYKQTQLNELTLFMRQFIKEFKLIKK
jgi:hypothetical protein